MAKNVKHTHGGEIHLELAVSAGVTSGDVVTLNALTGLALTDRDGDGYAVVKLPLLFTAEISVTGADGVGNAAVSVGDKLYNDAGVINKDDSGVPMGYALGAVSSGATATILVGFAAL